MFMQLSVFKKAFYPLKKMYYDDQFDKRYSNETHDANATGNDGSRGRG